MHGPKAAKKPILSEQEAASRVVENIVQRVQQHDPFKVPLDRTFW
jgi:hypothetical protein